MLLSSSGLVLSARLKALGVDYIAIDKAERIGDNWRKRYDAVRFHIDKSICHMPFQGLSLLYLPHKSVR